MYKIVPFQMKHLELMDVRSHEQQFISDKDLINKIINASVAWTGIANKKIVCCWGYIVSESGIANLWLIPSIYIKNMPLSFFKKVKEVVLSATSEYKVLQTHCMNDVLHTRWMTFLGFQKKDVITKLHGNKDYVWWGKNGA